MRLTIYIPDVEATLIDSAGRSMDMAGSASEIIREALKLAVSTPGKRALLEHRRDVALARVSEIDEALSSIPP